ncbi:hypothetical protein HJC23_000028 [Cyclotella cryptica]|uniref:Uncharacterized protein n=1 Tax=Cyclotella cryptica TaxID=29204 RepID=A0ABD3P0Z5_9STRA|eukprot:CCRYP_018400-RA/>CCRYP_018400-RA protein AED:0.30 eAED:0.30 QI:0/-1/0/1/-1/1/1/0/280
MIASKPTKAVISWCADVLASCAVLVLVISWINDIQSPNNRVLSESFLRNGFCLSPLFDDTHLSCSKFDALCGILCLITMIVTKKSSLGGVAAYFFSHSYGHWNAAVTLAEDGSPQEERTGATDLFVLAAILSIGPLNAASDLVKADKMSKSLGNICAFLGLAVGVSVYALFIKRPCYALLYINIFIILANSLPRSILVGYTSRQDMEIRASKFRWAKLVSGLVVLAVVFSEPFYCDSFVKFIGGHAVFDVVLALDLFVHFMFTFNDELLETQKEIETKME